MFCLITSSKLSRQYFEFSLKVKVIGLNPGYLLKFFLLYKLSQKSTDLMDPPIAYCFTFCEYRYFFATLYAANDYDEQKHDNVIEACSRRRRRVLAIWVVKFLTKGYKIR